MTWNEPWLIDGLDGLGGRVAKNTPWTTQMEPELSKSSNMHRRLTKEFLVHHQDTSAIASLLFIGKRQTSLSPPTFGCSANSYGHHFSPAVDWLLKHASNFGRMTASQAPHSKIQTVAVAIVTHNAEKWLPTCLGSLRDSSLKPSAIVVVDNASTDGTVEEIQRSYPEVTLVVSERNWGFGKANNLAFQALRNKEVDAVYLLNQDAAVLPGTIGHLAKVLDAHPRYGIVSPIHYQGDGRELDFVFRSSLENERVSDSPDEAQDFAEVNFVNAAHWLVRRECLDKLGGFAPIFFHYGEDVNFVHRLKALGWKVGIDLGVGALHCRDGRPGSAERDLLRLYASFLVYACNPLLPSWRAVLGAWRRLLYNLCAMEVRPPRSFSRCIRHAIEDTPGIIRTRKHLHADGMDLSDGISVLDEP